MGGTRADALHVVASSGDVAALRAAMATEEGTRRLNSPGDRTQLFYAPLHCAAASGCLECVEVLLDAGARVNQTVEVPRRKKVEFDLGISIFATDEPGEDEPTLGRLTPLHVAAKHQHADVVRLLLAHGADRVSRWQYSASELRPVGLCPPIHTSEAARQTRTAFAETAAQRQARLNELGVSTRTSLALQAEVDRQDQEARAALLRLRCRWLVDASRLLLVLNIAAYPVLLVLSFLHHGVWAFARQLRWLHWRLTMLPLLAHVTRTCVRLVAQVLGASVHKLGVAWHEPVARSTLSGIAANRALRWASDSVADVLRDPRQSFAALALASVQTLAACTFTLSLAAMACRHHAVRRLVDSHGRMALRVCAMAAAGTLSVVEIVSAASAQASHFPACTLAACVNTALLSLSPITALIMGLAVAVGTGAAALLFPSPHVTSACVRLWAFFLSVALLLLSTRHAGNAWYIDALSMAVLQLGCVELMCRRVLRFVLSPLQVLGAPAAQLIRTAAFYVRHRVYRLCLRVKRAMEEPLPPLPPFVVSSLRLCRCLALFWSAALFASSALTAHRPLPAAIFALAALVQVTVAVLCTTFSVGASSSRAPHAARVERAAAAIYCRLDAGLVDAAYRLRRLVSHLLDTGWSGFVAIGRALANGCVRPLIAALRRPITAVWQSPHVGIVGSVSTLALTQVLRLGAARRASARITRMLRVMIQRGSSAPRHARMAAAYARALGAPRGLRGLVFGGVASGVRSLDALLLNGLHSSPAFAAVLCAIHACQAAALRICLRAEMQGSRSAITSFMARSASSAALAPAVVYRLGALWSVPSSVLCSAAVLVWLAGSAAVAMEGYERTRVDARQAAMRSMRAAHAHTARQAGEEVVDPCAICLDEMEGAVNVTMSELSCGHTFHAACISKWLNICFGDARCPFCRCRVEMLPMGGVGSPMLLNDDGTRNMEPGVRGAAQGGA